MSSVKFFEHPTYASNKDAWEKYSDLFNGDHDILTDEKYLWPHEFEKNLQKEGSSIRAIRERRSRYINWIRPILQRYVSLLFKNEPDFSAVMRVFEKGGRDEFTNVDGEGTDFPTFIKNKIALNYFLYGRAVVLTDSLPIQARNAAEERALGQRPFFELLPALDVKDWDIAGKDSARRGDLNWLRSEYTLLEPRESATEAPERYKYSRIYALDGGRYVQRLYRGDKADKLKLNDDNTWELVAEQAIGDFDYIPISYAWGEPWVKDISEIALLIHNTQSALDNQLLYQAFQRIIATGNFEASDSAILSESAILMLPEGMQITVVEPSNPAALIDRLNTLIQILFQVAFARVRLVPSDAKGIEGADTQREAKQEFIALLTSAGRDIEALTNQAVRDYAAFKGMSDFQEEVQFDFDITIEDLDQQIRLIQAFYDDIKKSETWYRETLKKIAVQMNLAEIDVITEEIDGLAVAQPTSARDEVLGRVLNGFAERA